MAKKMAKLKTNSKSGVNHIHDQLDSQTFSEQFSRNDLIWIVIGILLFVLLSYAVIHFDIVSIETFTEGMSKYNVSAANAPINGVLG